MFVLVFVWLFFGSHFTARGQKWCRPGAVRGGAEGATLGNTVKRTAGILLSLDPQVLLLLHGPGQLSQGQAERDPIPSHVLGVQ